VTKPKVNDPMAVVFNEKKDINGFQNYNDDGTVDTSKTFTPEEVKIELDKQKKDKKPT
jgi:hypothetical protein